MRDHNIFAFILCAIFLAVLATVLGATTNSKFSDCEAKGGVAVKTTTSWVCARIEVIGLTVVKGVAE